MPDQTAPPCLLASRLIRLGSRVARRSLHTALNIIQGKINARDILFSYRDIWSRVRSSAFSMSHDSAQQRRSNLEIKSVQLLLREPRPKYSPDCPDNKQRRESQLDTCPLCPFAPSFGRITIMPQKPCPMPQRRMQKYRDLWSISHPSPKDSQTGRSMDEFGFMGGTSHNYTLVPLGRRKGT